MTERQFEWTMRNNRPRAQAATASYKHRLHMNMSGAVEHAQSAVHVRDQAAEMLRSALPPGLASEVAVVGFDRGILSITAAGRVAFERFRRELPAISGLLQRAAPAIRKLALTCNHAPPAAEGPRHEVSQ